MTNKAIVCLQKRWPYKRITCVRVCVHVCVRSDARAGNRAGERESVCAGLTKSCPHWEN